MNDPWDVKSVRQSNQYLSCMKINGVPLLPPVLSKECYLEMQYYKLLAQEVEKRIQTLQPLILDSDTESSEDKTDAPELPESDQSYDISPEEIQAENKENVLHINTEKCLEDCYIEKVQYISNTYDNITSNFSIDTDSASSKLSSKFVIDLSLSVNETGRNLDDSINPSKTVDIPERDCDYPKTEQKEPITDVKNYKTADQLMLNVSINKDPCIDPLNFGQDGPSSLSCKSFTGSLNNIHTESVKQAQAIPLIRQRSYTVLIPSPMLLAHLEVQSINTGVDITSISMSESMSNVSNNNKKRRSWDLETAKVKWSSMALELKEKNIANKDKTINSKSLPLKSTTKKVPQVTAQRPRSLTQDKVKRSPPKVNNKSEPFQRPRKGTSPVRNSNPQSTGKSMINQKSAQKKKEDVENIKQNNTSESEDPATRVRELYDKIQKQQLVQMANLVEKQKKEQMLLQQVFEEQNNLLFTQLKTICPKSPIEVKEADNDQNETASRGPVSLSQLISQKQPEHSTHGTPVLSTLTETNNYINYCDNVLKKSRIITGSIKKPDTKMTNDKIESPYQRDGTRTRSYSPSRRSTGSTSRKLTYENSALSDRDNEHILTDRTNDTMADILNVTFPSDHSDECAPYLHKRINHCSSASESPLSAPTMAASYRSAERPIRSGDATQNSINSVCGRSVKPYLLRAPTAQERAAATKIVSFAKGYLVRRLMGTERVQGTVQTIRDALLCALQLHRERDGIRGADVDLHRRLIQQITAACYSLHDTFVLSSAAERCALIAADRSRRQALAARLPATPYRHTDVMSQSDSGAFPPRAKRQPPSLMTHSNYETFSGDKSVRRYMPSPRRRPWR